MRIDLSNDRSDRPADPVVRGVGVFAHLTPDERSPAEQARTEAAAPKRRARVWLTRDVMRYLTRLYSRLSPPPQDKE